MPPPTSARATCDEIATVPRDLTGHIVSAEDLGALREACNRLLSTLDDIDKRGRRRSQTSLGDDELSTTHSPVEERRDGPAKRGRGRPRKIPSNRARLAGLLFRSDEARHPSLSSASTKVIGNHVIVTGDESSSDDDDERHESKKPRNARGNDEALVGNRVPDLPVLTSHNIKLVGRYVENGVIITVAADELPENIVTMLRILVDEFEADEVDWSEDKSGKCFRLAVRKGRTSFKWNFGEHNRATCQTCANQKELCLRFEVVDEARILAVVALPAILRKGVDSNEDEFWVRDESARRLTSGILWS